MDYSLYETSGTSNLTTSSVPTDNMLSHLRALEYYSTTNKTFMNNATVVERVPTPNGTTYVHQQFYLLQHPFQTHNFTQFFNDSYYQCPSMQNPVGNLISMIMYTVVCVIGLFGNTLVIYVVLRFSKMKTVTNLYILNLAIADQSFLIGIPFLLITMYLNEWIFGSFLCKVYMVSTSITQFTSSIFLLIMAADRFIAVCHPISSPRFRTPFVSKLVSLIAWSVSAVFMLPVMLYANTVEKYSKDKQVSCNIMWPQDNGTGGSTFILYSLVLGFAVPLTFILLFYYLVIKKLKSVGPKAKSKEKKRSHKKVTKLVLTVILVYILCWLPYWISQLALINSPPEICKTKLEITVFILVGCLGYSNSSLNPILYAFLSDNFKKSFLKACTCARGKDINAQLQIENSFFPKFGKSRGSERFASTSKNPTTNFPKSGVESAVIMDQPAQRITTIAISNSHVAAINGTQRPPVLHTDL